MGNFLWLHIPPPWVFTNAEEILIKKWQLSLNNRKTKTKGEDNSDEEDVSEQEFE